MSDKVSRETFKVQGGQLLDKVKELIHEGNVRRVVIKQGDRVVVEFPVTIGAVGALLAPWLAAAGALAALLTECSIEVERVQDEGTTSGESAIPATTESAGGGGPTS
ncbi:MAG TPA: DUF4342 domain-containing protein [Thermomicrobiales bacterium]